MRTTGVRVVLFVVLALMSGCTQMQTYPGYGMWDDEVEPLGPVSFCKGGYCQGTDEGTQWPLALALPPIAATYHSALRQKASSIYHVPIEEIVLGEVNVKLTTEAVGTVRGWRAEAQAGRRRAGAARSGDSDSATRLRNLGQLHKNGLISDEEYERRRDEILDDL